MSTIVRRLSFPLFVYVATCYAASFAQQTVPIGVTVRDLVAHPRKYDGQLVRLRARLTFGFEGDNFLTDPPNSLQLDSKEDGAAIWFRYTGNDENVLADLNRALVASGTFTGYFRVIAKENFRDTERLRLDATEISDLYVPKRRPGFAPRQVVEEYCKARFRSFEWENFSRYITWGDEPGWDEYVLVTGFEVGQVTERGDTATVPVTYHVIADFGFSSPPQINVKRENETVEYHLLRTPTGWRINLPDDLRPHPNIRRMIQHLRDSRHWPADVFDEKMKAEYQEAAAKLERIVAAGRP